MSPLIAAFARDHACVRVGMLAMIALSIAAIPVDAQKPPSRPSLTQAPAASPSRYSVETFASGLEYPWSLAFLPDGRLLVTERPGRLRIVGSDGALSPPLGGVPEVAATGQGGLLDVVLAPDFTATSLVYFSFAEPRGRNNGTAVARGRLVTTDGRERLEGVQVIFRQIPDHRGGLHFGSRLAFAPDGRLFVTLGERFEMRFAQDLGRHWGKVVRLDADGRAPPDNPFVGQAGAAPEIWSTGHRNPQSAAIHPDTGTLWIVEHGPRGGDEINIIERGANYGWPIVGYGIDYSGARLHQSNDRPGMEPPAYYWAPSIAPSGMAFYTGAMFPDWRGNLFVGALAGRALHRLVLDGRHIVAEEIMLRERPERIRDVRQGPDGALWVLTDAAEGRVLRIVPGT